MKKEKTKAWAVVSKSDGWILEIILLKKKPTRTEAKVGLSFKIVPCEISLP